MQMAEWAAQLLGRYGGELPEDYCCIDLETTGFSRKQDLIVEIGHCLVYDREIEQRCNLVLNWVDHPEVPNDWLADRLKLVAYKMREAGHEWHITMDYLQKEGIKPLKVLEFYYELINILMENETLLVFHNGFNFDEPMLQNCFRDFCGITDFSFGDDRVLDTSALTKASQLLQAGEIRVAPQPNETMREYYLRIHHGRAKKGIKSNLGFCIEHFNLSEKCDLESENLHSAGTDAWVCHFLVEELRSFIRQAEQTPIKRSKKQSTNKNKRIVHGRKQIRY